VCCLLPFAAHELGVFHGCHADFFGAGVLANEAHVAGAHRLFAQAQVLANQHANPDAAHVETVQKVVNLLLVRKFNVLGVPRGTNTSKYKTQDAKER